MPEENMAMITGIESNIHLMFLNLKNKKNTKMAKGITPNLPL
jgi:hypothetical protein